MRADAARERIARVACGCLLLVISALPLAAEPGGVSNKDAPVHRLIAITDRASLERCLEEGRRDYEAHEFAKAEEHLRAVREAIESKRWPDDAIHADCLRMLSRIYYPHLKDRTQDALDAAHRYHEIVRSTKGYSYLIDPVVCESAVHLAKIYLHLNRPADGAKVLQEVPLSDLVCRDRPAVELDLWLQRAKLAERLSDTRRTAMCWEMVGRSLKRLGVRIGEGKLTPPQTVELVPVLAEVLASAKAGSLAVEESPAGLLQRLAEYLLVRSYTAESAQAWAELADALLAVRGSLSEPTKGGAGLDAPVKLAEKMPGAWDCLTQAVRLRDRRQRVTGAEVQHVARLGQVAMADDKPDSGDRSRRVARIERSVPVVAAMVEDLEEAEHYAHAAMLRYRLARLLSALGQYDQATEEAEKVLAVCSGDRTDELVETYYQAKALLRMVVAAELRSKASAGAEEYVATAVARLERDVRLLMQESPPRPREVLRALEHLAALLADQGRYTQSRERYLEAIEYLGRLDVGKARISSAEQLALRAGWYDGLGTLSLALGRYDDANRCFEAAIGCWKSSLRERGQPPGSKNDTGAEVAGQAAESVESWRRHLQDRLWLSYCNLARVARAEGKNYVVLNGRTVPLQEYLRQMRDELPDRSPSGTAHQATIYNALADLYANRGVWKKALENVEQAERFLPQDYAPDHPERLTAKYVRAVSYWQAAQAELNLQTQKQYLDNAEKALLDLQERAQGNASWRGRTQRWLGQVAYAKSALALAQGNPQDKQTCLAAARKHYEVAVKEMGDNWPVAGFLARFHLALISYEERKIPEAIGHLEDAINNIEKAGATTTGTEAERDRFYAHFVEAYDLLMRLLVGESQPNEDQPSKSQLTKALLYAEKFRNRTLGDELQVSYMRAADPLNSRSTPSCRPLVSDVEKLWRIRPTPEAQGGRNPDAATRRPLADGDDASDAYRRALSEAAVTQDVEGLDKQIETLKQRKQFVLYYYLSDVRPRGGSGQFEEPESYLWVIGHGGIKPHRLAISADNAARLFRWEDTGPEPTEVAMTRSRVAQLVEACLKEYLARCPGSKTRSRGLGPAEPLPLDSSPGPGSLPLQPFGPQQALALAETLLPRAVRDKLATANCERVIIVPDGALHCLPFQALPLEVNSDSLGRSYVTHFVVDDEQIPPISYLPSLRVLKLLEERTAQQQSRQKVLTFGFNADADGNPSSPGEWMMEEECTTVAGLFPGRTITPLLVGRRARENLLEMYAGQALLLLLSAHGVYDGEKNDNESGRLQLCGDALELREVDRLNLHGCEAVVLSACHTNVGSKRYLEMGNSLARAFLAAGATRVMATFWGVNDQAASELVPDFFKEVANDMNAGRAVDYARALQQAMRNWRDAHSKDPVKSAPYFWAPFALIGPPSSTPAGAGPAQRAEEIQATAPAGYGYRFSQ